ncbi:hypothetical protein JCM11641_008010 [Rhodosporidiobolus odoratus]
MRSVLALSTVASLAGIAAAQSGYGRFPCTVVNGDGTFSPDATQCTDLVAPGTGDGVPGVDMQGDLPAPTGAACQIEEETGSYFCGIDGAACTSDEQCDNGLCGPDGTCQGGFLQACAGDDSNCLGYLYCTGADTGSTDADACGAFGSFCQDATPSSNDFTDAENYAIFNQFCSSGYCNFGTGACDVHAQLGEDCSTDPEFGCADGLTCDQSTFTCAVAAVPSGRARSRRNQLHRRNLCPASHSACSLSSGGFECVDTSSNLEQCGGCASQGGVDCTAIAGAESVGCVDSVCEIWSCQEGFSYDAEKEACVSA